METGIAVGVIKSPDMRCWGLDDSLERARLYQAEQFSLESFAVANAGVQLLVGHFVQKRALGHCTGPSQGWINADQEFAIILLLAHSKIALARFPSQLSLKGEFAVKVAVVESQKPAPKLQVGVGSNGRGFLRHLGTVSMIRAAVTVREPAPTAADFAAEALVTPSLGHIVAAHLNVLASALWTNGVGGMQGEIRMALGPRQQLEIYGF